MCSTSQRDSNILNQIKGVFIALWSYSKVERAESLTLSDNIIGKTYPYLNCSLENLTSVKIITHYMIYWKLTEFQVFSVKYIYIYIYTYIYIYIVYLSYDIFQVLFIHLFQKNYIISPIYQSVFQDLGIQ